MTKIYHLQGLVKLLINTNDSVITLPDFQFSFLDFQMVADETSVSKIFCVAARSFIAKVVVKPKKSDTLVLLLLLLLLQILIRFLLDLCANSLPYFSLV